MAPAACTYTGTLTPPRARDNFYGLEVHVAWITAAQPSGNPELKHMQEFRVTPWI